MVARTSVKIEKEREAKKSIFPLLRIKSLSFSILIEIITIMISTYIYNSHGCIFSIYTYYIV